MKEIVETVLCAPAGGRDYLVAQEIARVYGLRAIKHIPKPRIWPLSSHVMFLTTCAGSLPRQLVIELQKTAHLNISVVNAPDPSTLRSRTEAIFAANERTRSARVWMMAPKRLLAHITGSLEKHETEELNAETFQKICSKPADLAIVVGHGREDLIYFPHLAICGRPAAVGTVESFPCRADFCPYPQPKAAIQLLNATMVVLLTCSAVRFGPGMFPHICRLHNCLIDAGAAAVLGPSSIFTLSVDLVKQCVEHLLAGFSLSETSRHLSAWQKDRIGKPEAFPVAGNGSLRLNTNAGRANDVRFSRKRKCDPLPHDKLNWTQRLQMVDAGMFELGEMRLLTPECRRFMRLLDQHSNLLAQALLCLADGRQSSNLVKPLHLLDRELATLDLAIAENLASRSRRGFFWLAARSKCRVVSQSREDVCPHCRATTSVDSWTNPLRPSQPRERITCERCGIIADRCDWHGQFHLVLKGIRWAGNRAYVRVKLCSTSTQRPFAAAVGVNHAGAWLYPARAVCAGKLIRFPARLRLSDLKVFDLVLAGAPKGIHYLQLFLVQDMCVSSGSVPVPLWASCRARPLARMGAIKGESLSYLRSKR